MMSKDFSGNSNSANKATTVSSTAKYQPLQNTLKSGTKNQQSIEMQSRQLTDEKQKTNQRKMIDAEQKYSSELYFDNNENDVVFQTENMKLNDKNDYDRFSPSHATYPLRLYQSTSNQVLQKVSSEANLIKLQGSNPQTLEFIHPGNGMGGQDQELNFLKQGPVYSQSNLLEVESGSSLGASCYLTNQKNEQPQNIMKKGLLSSSGIISLRQTSNSGEDQKKQKQKKNSAKGAIDANGGQIGTDSNSLQHLGSMIKESFHTLRLSERNSSNMSQNHKPVNHTYIILAILASLFNSTGQIIRGYESGNVTASNFLQNATFCIIPFIILLLKKIQAKRRHEAFVMPWFQLYDPFHHLHSRHNHLHHSNSPNKNSHHHSHNPSNKSNQPLLQQNPAPNPIPTITLTNTKPRYIFKPKVLLVLLLGGACEFIGCYFLVCSFHYGQLAGMNDGVGSSLILFSSVYILTMQFIIYRDKINWVQSIGMGVILVAVLMVSIFRADDTQEEQYLKDLDQEKQHLHGEHSEQFFKFLAIGTGLLAAALFGQEIVFVRTLTTYKVDGELAGYFYPLIVGFMGIIGISIYLFTLSDFSTLHYQTYDYFIILCGGLCESIGMVLQIVASSIGIGGIAFSLANTCCIFVTLFNYVVFSQPIASLQVIGIVLAVVGASIISLDDKIKDLFSKKKQQSNNLQGQGIYRQQ